MQVHTGSSGRMASLVLGPRASSGPSGCGSNGKHGRMGSLGSDRRRLCGPSAAYGARRRSMSTPAYASLKKRRGWMRYKVLQTAACAHRLGPDGGRVPDGVHAAAQAFGEGVDKRGWTRHRGPAGDLVEWGLGCGLSALLGVETHPVTQGHMAKGAQHEQEAA